ncbi:MAG: RNA polymerase sigma factor [Myxococcaceae bacterium]|nr:RNA polymerase sigma factor [Myxococcaceae bacterium]
MSRPSDEELMLRFCSGDESAFDALFERHAVAVHGFISRIVRDSDLANDLLQVTFLSVVRARNRFQPGALVKPWLFTIAGNAARDLLRHDKRAMGSVEERRQSRERSLEVAFPDPGLRRLLSNALAALSADQREAVLLHKVEGWSFSEIAAAAGITETAARIRAHRGYEKLRQILGPQVEM